MDWLNIWFRKLIIINNYKIINYQNIFFDNW
jgi:hypothetical protein